MGTRTITMSEDFLLHVFSPKQLHVRVSSELPPDAKIISVQFSSDLRSLTIELSHPSFPEEDEDGYNNLIDVIMYPLRSCIVPASVKPHSDNA